MARIVIIGGGGHVGTFLVPQLVEAGHEVVNVSRGLARPYRPNAAWAKVRQVTLDRTAEEAAGRFGPAIAALAPEIVIDMICFTPASAAHLADALEGRVRHLLHVGTIWVHGPLTTVPAREEDPRAPFGQYGIDKSLIEDLLLDRAQRGRLPATVVRPAISSAPAGCR